MRSPALGRLLGLAALRPLLASPAEPGDALGLFQSNVRLSPEALHFEQSMPAAVDLEHVDHSGLATKFLGILQGTRFHRSFMFLNNLSAATGDLYSHTQGELNHLKTGLKKADNKQALELVVKFFAKEREAVQQFSNVTESKLSAYLDDLTEEDNTWLRPMTTSVVRHMTQLLAPLYEKVRALDGLADGPSICSTVQLILNDLRSVDEVIKEREIPAFNKTSSLVPAMETTSSKGRLKMLKRFADQGYAILEKVRSVVAMPNGTFAPLLAERLPCGAGASAPTEVLLHSEGSAPALAADQAEPTHEPAPAVEAAPTAEAKAEEKQEAKEEQKKEEPKEVAKKEEEPKEQKKEEPKEVATKEEEPKAAPTAEARAEEKQEAREEQKKEEPKEVAKKEEEPKEQSREEQRKEEQRKEEERKELQRQEKQRQEEEAQRKEEQSREEQRKEEQRKEEQRKEEERRKEEQRKAAEELREWQRKEEQRMEEKRAEAAKLEQQAQQAEDLRKAELEKVERKMKELKEEEAKLEAEKKDVYRREEGLVKREQQQRLEEQKWEERKKAEAALQARSAAQKKAEDEAPEYFEPQYDAMQVPVLVREVQRTEDRSAAFTLAPGTLAALALLALLHA